MKRILIFHRRGHFQKKINDYPNLLVMQTLSKAWGLAALRVGFCFAGKEIIDLFNKVKPPYNVNEASQQLAFEALQETDTEKKIIEEIIQQRKFLEERLVSFPFVKNFYKSDANFLLLKVDNADKLYRFLLESKIVVRNRSKDTLCENCIRVTVGTPQENQILLNALKNYT